MNFKLSIDDFDKSILPTDTDLLDKDPDLLRRSIIAFFSDRFNKLGGTAEISIDDTSREIRIKWAAVNTDNLEDIIQYAVSLLTSGQLDDAIPFLKLVLAQNPTETSALYNLGMIYSDRGKLDTAIEYLSQVVKLSPDFSNAWVAMGVALARKGKTEESINALERAVKIDPTNGYACRNYAALLLKTGDAIQSRAYYEKACDILPDDPQTLLGFGQCMFVVNDFENADRILKKVVDLRPTDSVGEAARELRNRIAAHNFRQTQLIRTDAVFYCLAAMGKFSKLQKPEVQNIAFEIAMLGRHGLDVNNPDTKYRLKSMPGDFSGLQLLSYMYVGFKIIDPAVDVGFDLSKEYETAKSISGSGY